jgi:hypothetical protein
MRYVISRKKAVRDVRVFCTAWAKGGIGLVCTDAIMGAGQAVVFECNGNFYLADWKSNDPGDHDECYEPAPIKQNKKIRG